MSSYSATRIYGVAEIETFLGAVDRHLTAPARIVVIGGSAAAIHNATSVTNDVDTYQAISVDLESAARAAASETGLAIVVNHSPVAEVPYHYERRLERYLPALDKLEVWVLEKHDLVLSKAVRGAEHDEQQILEIHDRVGLDFETLVQRFAEEMSHVVGDPARLRAQFLSIIELLFGELKRSAAERRLR